MDSKKKVIILNYGLHISGVSRALVNFANYLVEHGYDVTVKLAVNDFTLAKELNHKVKCSLFLKEWWLFGKRVKGFLRFYNFFQKLMFRVPSVLQYWIVIRGKYDVEIAFNRGASARIISASTNRTAKKIAWVHSDYMRNSNPLAGFCSVKEAARAYARFNYVICVSEQARQSFQQMFGDTRNTTARYNIMDVNNILKLSILPVQKKKFTVVAVGRLAKEKNYTLLLDAISILNNRRIDLDLWIVGDGELKQELVDYTKKKCLDNVIFWGEQENPYPYFASADLYVSSSVYEGLSTTTIEALILGKPVVVTDCVGMRDILGDDEWGMVVPIQVNSLADAIEKMIQDDKLRRHYAMQARIRAQVFSPEKCFQKIEELMI